MKKLLSLVIVCAFFSCKKEEKAYCYTCDIVNTISGIPTHRYLDTCSDSPSSTYYFEDANHNQLSHSCQLK